MSRFGIFPGAPRRPVYVNNSYGNVQPGSANYGNVQPLSAPTLAGSPTPGLQPQITPMLPPGYQAPSPGYVDQMNRVGEAADYRRQSADNFRKSLDVTRAQHGMPGVPAAPTMPFSSPTGYGAPGMAPTPGVDKQAKAYRDLVGNGIAPGMSPQSAQQMAGFPSTQPTAPTTMPAPHMSAPAGGYPNPPGNQVQLTAEHLRAMWEVERQHNPNANPEDFQQRIAAQYGVQGGLVNGPDTPMTGGAPTVRGAMEGWNRAGTQGQRSTDLVPGQPIPGVPLSMLGTDRGQQYSVGDGTASRVAAGQQGQRTPSIPTTQQRGPEQGYTPLAKAPAQPGNDLAGQQRRQTAAQILQRAGGDKAMARKMAAEMGFDISPTN